MDRDNRIRDHDVEARKAPLRQVRHPSRLLWAIIGAATLWTSAWIVHRIDHDELTMENISANLRDQWKAIAK